MKNLMNVIVLSCKKASFLTEKSLEAPLSFADKLRLHLHLKICNPCADYKKQSSFISQLIKNSSKESSLNYKLTQSTKNSMQEALNQHLNNNE